MDKNSGYGSVVCRSLGALCSFLWHFYMNIRDIKMRKEEVALNSTSLLSFKVHEIDRYSPMSKEFLGEIHIYIFYTSHCKYL